MVLCRSPTVLVFISPFALRYFSGKDDNRDEKNPGEKTKTETKNTRRKDEEKKINNATRINKMAK